jgi:hypothetical protein
MWNLREEDGEVTTMSGLIEAEEVVGACEGVEWSISEP